MKDYLALYLKEEDEDLKDPGGTALTKLTKPRVRGVLSVLSVPNPSDPLNMAPRKAVRAAVGTWR